MGRVTFIEAKMSLESCVAQTAYGCVSVVHDERWKVNAVFCMLILSTFTLQYALFASTAKVFAVMPRESMHLSTKVVEYEFRFDTKLKLRMLRESTMFHLSLKRGQLKQPSLSVRSIYIFF